MNTQPNDESFFVELLYTGYYKVGRWWNFKHLISPFHRLFYITAGNCTITIENRGRYELHAGDLFLVPKFVDATYECAESMEHYYICLTDNKEGCISVINPTLLNVLKKATDIDRVLIERLLDICPNRTLPSVDPQQYDNNKDLWKINEKTHLSSLTIERQGILLQLFSRFITSDSLHVFYPQSHLHTRLALTVQYINDHISSKISIKELAEKIYISPDHFSKSFKKIMGLSPNDYIQRQRINIARNLLTHTQLSVTEIAQRVGFDYNSQFSKMFTQKMGISPSAYKEQTQQDIHTT